VGNQLLEGEYLLAGILLGSVFLLMSLTYFYKDKIIAFAIEHGKLPAVPASSEVLDPGDGLD
jgi:hypothetical protein